MRRMVIAALMMFSIGSRVVAQRADRTRGLLLQAVEAQLGGPGGCFDVQRLDTLPFRYGNAVTLVRGRCEREHGDSAEAYAIQNAEGQVFIMGSVQALRFFLAASAPRFIRDSAAVDYAEWLVRLSTSSAPGYRVVRSPDRVQMASKGSTAVDKLPRNMSSVVSKSATLYTVRVVWASTARHRVFTVMFHVDGRVFAILEH